MYKIDMLKLRKPGGHYGIQNEQIMYAGPNLAVHLYHLFNSMLCHFGIIKPLLICCNGDETCKWKRPKFDPSPCQNSLSYLHKNWHASLLVDGTRHTKFCSDRGFCCPNTWLWRASGVTSFRLIFWGFFNKAYSPELIFTQNTSTDVIPDKEVPFWGPADYI